MARLQAVVDLPTPPLPEATAMILSTPSIGRPLAGRARGAGLAEAFSAVSVTSTAPTPGSALTARSTAACIGAILAASAGLMRMAMNTLSSRWVTPSMAPDCGSGVRPSGPGTAARAARISD